MTEDFSDYDYWYRHGIFHKCNGYAAKFIEDETDLAVCAYFDGYNANEMKIQNAPELEIEVELEERKIIYHVYSERAGEIEGMFDDQENLLDFWANNDACWRNEYFAPFLSNLGIDVVETDNPVLTDKLLQAASDRWGIDIDPEE